MTMKVKDRKRLWARSGNTCSFPNCEVQLAQEGNAKGVTGDEAHIKGENAKAPRFDPNQSEEERESYENRILLCPTHHREIDGVHPEYWTVERLLQIKANHERQVEYNKMFPKLVGDFVKSVQPYLLTPESFDYYISETVKDTTQPSVVRVDASIEGGVNTKIHVLPGQRAMIFARGLVSFDSRHTFATPEGILCNELGLPLYAGDADDPKGPIIFPHLDAYKTSGGKPGIVGSLFGWINTYSQEGAFFVGSKREIEISEEGFLYLSVNDARGTYADNDGEFRVDIQIVGNE